jgi:hypothetical protein
MNWKTESRLSDLDPTTRFELTCRRCGLMRYETQAVLIRHAALRYATLDRVEASLACADRFCRGKVRLALVYDDLNEAFVGGMA